MQLVDNICYEYRGRLSIMEALNMPIGDLMLLYKFIRDRREAADAAAEKERISKAKCKRISIFKQPIEATLKAV